MFSCEYCRFFRNNCFYRTSPMSAPNFYEKLKLAITDLIYSSGDTLENQFICEIYLVEKAKFS